ncbi:MAG: helix-turn-helix transcriptional regulator [Bacteroidetes bacterium]|nr:helix-turn-helix transcriptional regulator [Bacteroidota bacterium]
MNNFGQKVRELRVQNASLLRQVAAFLEVDTALMSKIENGTRRATKEQVIKIAAFFKSDQNELIMLWLSDKIYAIIDEDNNNTVAEDAVEYTLRQMKSK